MATKLTVAQAKKWVEEAERRPAAELPWDELRAAAVALRSVVEAGLDVGSANQRPWIERVMALTKAKTAPVLAQAEAGDDSPEVVSELAAASEVLQQSSRKGDQADFPADQEFIDRVSTFAQKVSEAERGKRTRGRPVAAVEKSEAAEAERKAADTVKAKFVATGRKVGLTTLELESQWQMVQAQAQAFGMTIDDAVNEQVAAWESQLIAARGEALGVPAGFEATRRDPGLPGFNEQRAEFLGSETPEGALPTVTGVAPRFFDGDEMSPSGLSEERRAQLQEQMVKSGLLESGSYYSGWWDDESAEAYRVVLGYSNRWGLDPEETLDRLEANLPEAMKKAGADPTVFASNTFMAPDYATLAQNVKAMTREKLGRDPTPQELSELAGQLGGFTRAEFDAEEAARRAAFDASQAAPDGTEPAPVVGQAVDPYSRFAELFEQRFKPEIDRLGALDDVQRNSTNVFAALTNMSSLIGG